MASNDPRSTSPSTSIAAFALKSSASRRIAPGDRIRASTARVLVCSGGSASSTMLGGRHGFSLK
jgi:hypothetical protein